MYKNRLSNISLVFTIAAILSVIGIITVPGKNTSDSLSMFSLFIGTPFSLLFTCTGFFLGTRKSLNNKKALKAALSPALTSCILFAGIAVFIFFFIQVSAKGTNIAFILRQLIFLPIKGFPAQLWIIPVIIISVVLIYLLRKLLTPKKIIGISAVFYLISTIILNFSVIFPKEIYSIHRLCINFSGAEHAGVFSGLIFIVLGMYLAEKKNYRKMSVYFCGTVLSAVCLIAEVWLIQKSGGCKTSFFCISSVFLVYNLTAFTALCPEIRFADHRLLTEFGKSFFLTGQLLAGARIFLKNYPGSVFAKFFTTEEASLEFILFSALCISVFYCANKSDSEDITGVFIHLLQKVILTAFYLPAVLVSKIDDRIRNAVCAAAFAALPVLLWFIERQIKHSLCCDLFFICLAVILLCSLDKRLTPARVSAGFFTGFLIISVAVYLSSVIYSVTGYTDIGRMMLFFFLPLGIQLAGSKEKISVLLKNYTYGLYISFGIFVFYCACFRPYDITRYKGAFCNANMCGLYLVAVCLAALCNLPQVRSLKDIIKQPLHWLVFGTSFAFVAFTISRTAAVGVAAALAIKFSAEYFAVGSIRSVSKNTVKKAAASVGILILVMSAGLVVSYAAIRCIPAIVDNPIFLLVEFTDTYEYKVKPGEGFFSENYISPLRFFEAWLSRSFSGAESINDLSTGRIDIYAQYLKSITLRGHNILRLPIEATGEYMYAHNVFLQLAYNCGLPVGLGFLGLCAAAIIRALRKTVKDKKFIIFGAVGIAAYSACGMFESMECFYYPLLFSALTGFMILAVSPSPKDSDTAFTISASDEKTDITVKEAKKTDILTVKKIILCALAVLLLAIFIFFLLESRNSQEGMKIFYQFMN